MLLKATAFHCNSYLLFHVKMYINTSRRNITHSVTVRVCMRVMSVRMHVNLVSVRCVCVHVCVRACVLVCVRAHDYFVI